MARKPATNALPSRIRGIYDRVAKRLGVDASYVSRVARGERRSAEVSAAIEKEIQHLFKASLTDRISRLRNGSAQRVLEERLMETGGKLLKTQLDTAFLFLTTAMILGGDDETKRWNLMKARKGSENARSLLRHVRLHPGDEREIQAKLHEFDLAYHELTQGDSNNS